MNDDRLEKIEKWISGFYKRKNLYMIEIKLDTIAKLIKAKQIDEAQLELSKLGTEFHRNAEYLYLRSEIFFIKKLYYVAIDTLLIALEFEKKDKIYNLIGKIYDILGNNKLSQNFLDSNLRLKTSNSLKDEMTGIYRKS